MKGKILKERGITLIALVITIIVLLILAGVTLSIVLHTGIIDNSQKAVDTYQAQTKNETETMNYLQDKFSLYISYLDNINGKENKKMIEDEDVGYTYYNPVVPVGFKAVNTEEANWKIVEDKKLGKIVEGWNNGLVIEDKDGNQFVWVPAQEVGGGNGDLVEYTKVLGEKNKNITDLKQVEKDDLPDGIDKEKQIGKYGGFYIARYEAGIPEGSAALKPEPTPENTREAMKTKRSIAGVPVSKKNQVPWNNITYTQAKENAESMYNDSEYVKSGLLTGTMWDTTLQWLLKTNAVTNEELNNDSKSWGNYRTSTIPGVTWRSEYINFLTGVEWLEGIVTKPGRNEDVNSKEFIWLLKTGNTEYTKRNNIYDLAGNLWEWTYEEDITSSERVSRGGSCSDCGPDYPASYRNHHAVTFSSGNVVFRVALYIL